MTYRNVPYETDDLNAIVGQYDTLQANIRSIKASAAAEVGHKKKAVENLLKEGADLGIPKSLLKKKFKKRDKQAQIDEIDESVEEDDVEVWEELNRDVDQFDSTPLGQAASTAGASDVTSPVDHGAEQAEGAEVLKRAPAKKLTAEQKAARNPVGIEDQR